MRDQALLRRFYSTPWAIEAPLLAEIRGVLHRHAAGVVISAEDLAAITAAAPKRTSPASSGSIAVLPLWGVVSPHQVNDVSSGPTTALDSWGALFDELVADSQVGTIVLNVDSPGGSTDLVAETAAKVRAASARKEIVAVANTRAASAAYWIASQAGTLIVSPSGAVGSIGVYAAHEDVSAQLETEGVKVTLISAGAHKVDGNPFEPLSDGARATIQENVDAFYGMFIGDVAKGRGVDVGRVEKAFGQGKMVLAAEAVRAGMADGVGTLEQTLARLQAGKPAVGRGARADEFTPAVSTNISITSTGSVSQIAFAATDMPSTGNLAAPASDDGDRREVARQARTRHIKTPAASARSAATPQPAETINERRS